MANKKKALWIELTRIFACIAVVLLHITSRYIKSMEPFANTWKYMVTLNGFTRFAVPCFIMISGILYTKKATQLDITQFYKRYLPKTVLIYLISSFSYTCMDKIYNKTFIFNIEFLKQMVKSSVKHPYYHLWYLSMLIGIIILAPFLSKFLTDEKDGKKYTISYIVIFLILVTLPKTLRLFDVPFKDVLLGLFSRFGKNLIFEWTGFYVIGYFFYQYYKEKKWDKLIYISGFLSMTASILLSFYKIELTTKNTMFFKNNVLFSLIYSVAVFLLIKNTTEHINFSEKAEKIILNLSSSTLGVYLIHPFVLLLLRDHKILEQYMKNNYYLSVILLLIVTLLICFLSVMVYRKVVYFIHLGYTKIRDCSV